MSLFQFAIFFQSLPKVTPLFQEVMTSAKIVVTLWQKMMGYQKNNTIVKKICLTKMVMLYVKDANMCQEPGLVLKSTGKPAQN